MVNGIVGQRRTYQPYVPQPLHDYAALDKTVKCLRASFKILDTSSDKLERAVARQRTRFIAQILGPHSSFRHARPRQGADSDDQGVPFLRSKRASAGLACSNAKTRAEARAESRKLLVACRMNARTTIAEETLVGAPRAATTKQNGDGSCRSSSCGSSSCSDIESENGGSYTGGFNEDEDAYNLELEGPAVGHSSFRHARPRQGADSDDQGPTVRMTESMQAPHPEDAPELHTPPGSAKGAVASPPAGSLQCRKSKAAISPVSSPLRLVSPSDDMRHANGHADEVGCSPQAATSVRPAGIAPMLVPRVVVGVTANRPFSAPRTNWFAGGSRPSSAVTPNAQTTPRQQSRPFSAVATRGRPMSAFRETSEATPVRPRSAFVGVQKGRVSCMHDVDETDEILDDDDDDDEHRPRREWAGEASRNTRPPCPLRPRSAVGNRQRLRPCSAVAAPVRPTSAANRPSSAPSGSRPAHSRPQTASAENRVGPSRPQTARAPSARSARPQSAFGNSSAFGNIQRPQTARAQSAKFERPRPPTSQSCEPQPRCMLQT